MAAYAAVPSGLANAIRNSQQGKEEGRSTKRSRDASRRMGSEPLVLAPENLLCAEESENGQKKVARATASPGRESAGDGRFSNVGTGVLDAGASLMNRVGSVARFIGHAVAEGGGDGVGLDYRALAAFAPQSANTRSSVNRTNRSSLQARKYLVEE
jgi:hypothetical protein